MTHTETHSPLPWSKRGEDELEWIDANGEVVLLESGQFNQTEDEDFVFRSVNALPSLVEALEKAQECFEGTMRNRDYLFVRGTTVLEDIEAALALALAKGE